VSPSTISVLSQVFSAAEALVGGLAGAMDSSGGREMADVAVSEPDDEQLASTTTAINRTSGTVCRPRRVEMIDRGRRNSDIAVTLSPVEAESQHDRQGPGERRAARSTSDASVLRCVTNKGRKISAVTIAYVVADAIDRTGGER
jgi:hypothetical protein